MFWLIGKVIEWLVGIPIIIVYGIPAYLVRGLSRLLLRWFGREQDEKLFTPTRMFTGLLCGFVVGAVVTLVSPEKTAVRVLYHPTFWIPFFLLFGFFWGIIASGLETMGID